MERLAEGRDDALIGVGLPGRLALEFVREAHSAHEAIEGAIEDVRRAIPNARLIETALAPTVTADGLMWVRHGSAVRLSHFSLVLPGFPTSQASMSSSTRSAI